MSVQATCFHCQHPNSFADKWAGRVMRCQKCGGILTLPKVHATFAPAQDLEAVAQARQPVTPLATFPVVDPRDSAAAGTGARASVPQVFPRPVAASPKAAATEDAREHGARPGSLAALLCGVNGAIVLLVGAGAALLALPQTRPTILDKLHMTPAAGPEAAWAVAGAALLLGGLYLVCALRMKRGAGFARFAAVVALAQTLLQIAALVYMTLQGKLNYAALGFITVSLIALCGLIDLAVRVMRASERGRTLDRPAAIASDAGLQPGLT